MIGTVILNISYGYDANEHGEHLINLVQTATDQFSELSQPGAFLADSLPKRESICMAKIECGLTVILTHPVRHLPSWFPGMSWKRSVPEWSRTLHAAAEQPLAFVKRQIVSY